MLNKKIVVLDVVGLTLSLVGENTPNINRYINENFFSPLTGVFPAVTTTAQSSMLTGYNADRHGIVGNGWYERDHAEIMFWKQANTLVQGHKIWDRMKAKQESFSCSKLFWWFNMYANVDASITPRPHYPADGRKIIDLYSTPSGLHEKIEAKLGKFPFFNFWGPKAGIESSEWIAQAAKLEFEMNQPNLQLVYLPHLDYCLQKFGSEHESIADEVQAIDKVVGSLLEFYLERDVKVIIVSEYGINEVNTPVHINRILRDKGYINVRNSLTWELLDPGASTAFAVADHQVAHIYINDANKKEEIKKILENTEGIDQVLDDQGKRDFNIDHERAGDLVAIAQENAWFTYYYWLDDDKAPDFARTVDIHRKPGYDPVEMFVDPTLTLPMARVAWRLLQKKLGFRMLMDVIPLDANLICGSHGRLASNEQQAPLIIMPKEFAQEGIRMTDLPEIIMPFFE